MARLPLWLLYIISDLFYLINYYVVGYRKKVIFKNLNIAFPELNTKQKKVILRKFYRNLGDIVMETIKGLRITKEELQKRITFEGIEIIEEAKRNNKNVVLLTAHQANWEWSLQCANILFPLEIHGIYKPLSNEGFDRIVYQIRTRFGGSLIPMDKVVRNIIENKNKVRIIGIIGDQRPHIGVPKHWNMLFGIDTAFSPGSYQIPKMMDAVTIYIKVVRKKRGHYENQIKLIADPPYEKDDNSVMDKYVQCLEEAIREAPSDWLWSHNRWKYDKEEELGLFE